MLPLDKYFLVSIQSYSDVVTNSSSETYVVDTSYNAKALQEALDAVHEAHADDESYSGEACGVEVETFEEYLSEVDTWGVLCDEYGNPFESTEDYVSWVWELPLSTLKECLFVRVDYGYPITDKYLVENFKCIGSDHERAKDENGRVTSI